jgi:myo-inositol-1(or 4)-monophosphatase
MRTSSIPDTLQRIETALHAAVGAISPFFPGNVKVDFKCGDDPVTEADRAADRVLREILLRDGEGWLSEESADDLTRLNKERVWVVDPLDGTREFLAGIPEWCVSVGLVENGRAIAGGICNPATRETFVGSLSTGLIYNGRKASPTRRQSLVGATVLASRSESKRGEWGEFRDAGFETRLVGSVAYKLALVSAGLADATWTLCPKNEWDIAAGVALMDAAGGFVQEWGGCLPSFNNKSPLKPGLLASSANLKEEILSLLESRVPTPTSESGGRS